MFWRHIMDIHFFPVFFFLLYSLRVWKSSIRTCYKHFITRQDCIVDYHLLLTSFNSAEKTNKQKMKKKNSSSSVIFSYKVWNFIHETNKETIRKKQKMTTLKLTVNRIDSNISFWFLWIYINKVLCIPVLLL